MMAWIFIYSTPTVRLLCKSVRTWRHLSMSLTESLTTNFTILFKAKNIPCAGRPSETPRRTSIAGRRSRRNSTEDTNSSQLSLENLGGSQDNLSMLGRNPDKEMRTHTGRKSEPSYNNDHQVMMNLRHVVFLMMSCHSPFVHAFTTMHCVFVS